MPKNFTTTKLKNPKTVLNSEIIDTPPWMLAIILQPPITYHKVLLATQSPDCVGRGIYIILTASILFNCLSNFLYVVMFFVEVTANFVNSRDNSSSVNRCCSKNKLSSLYFLSEICNSLYVRKFLSDFKASTADISFSDKTHLGYSLYIFVFVESDMFLHSANDVLTIVV